MAKWECMQEWGNGDPPSEVSDRVSRKAHHCHDPQEQGEFRVDSPMSMTRICVVVPEQKQTVDK